MAWFRRTEEVEPTNLEQYYADQGRSGLVSWLYAFGAFVITLVLVFGVFWAGRWVYRKATNDDKATKTATTKSSSDPFANTNIEQPSSSTNSSATQTANPQTQGASTAQGNTATSSTSSSVPSNTSTNTKAISNTGPGDTVALFVVASSVGVLLYQLRIRSKSSHLL